MKLKELQKASMPIEVNKKWYLMYCRKSSEAEDRQVESIPDQTKILNQLAKEKSLPVLNILSEARSAKKPGRPEFNKLVEIIDTQPDIKGILCWKVNRLFRNPEDEGKIRQRLYDGRIEEIATPHKTYVEADSDFTMAVEGAQAQRFIKDLREDTKRGMDSKLERGQFPGLAPPGYRNNTFKKQGDRDIAPHSTYFSLMRKLFDLALTGNLTLQNLVIKADELGIRNSRGKKISKSQMAVIMHNPFYAGKFMYSGKLYQGTHDAMLTEDEFDLLQDILSGRSRPRKQIHNFWHTGIPIVCGECGCCVTGEEHTKTYKNGKSQTFSHARCTKKDKNKKCTQPYTSVKELENQVTDFLSTIRLSHNFVEWAIKWLNVANEEQKVARDARFNALRKSYDEVVKKIDSLLDLKISPANSDSSLITDDEFAEKKALLIEEKNKLHDQLIKVDRHVEEWTELAAKTFDFAATAQERFANGSFDDRKTILRAIGSYLELKGKKLTIKPRTPFSLIQQALPEINSVKSLEPEEKIDTTYQSETLQPQFVVWGE